MALKKPWENEAGLLAEDAYYRITNVRFDIAAGVGGVDISVYQSRVARDAGRPPAATMNFNDVQDLPAVPAVMDGEDVVTAAIPARPYFSNVMARARVLVTEGMNVYDGIRTALYEHYRANRPEFAGAIDV